MVSPVQQIEDLNTRLEKARQIGAQGKVHQYLISVPGLWAERW
jgi:hypothetical protein